MATETIEFEDHFNGENDREEQVGYHISLSYGWILLVVLTSKW